MSRKASRAGAFASATILSVMLFAIPGSMARAEDEGASVPQINWAPPLTSSDTATADTEALPRFVASPVVQPLPEQVGTELLSRDDAIGSQPAASYASLLDLVAATPAAGEMGRDLRCLAKAIYFEARGEPLEGQLAVGRVIINRASSGLFPGDYCSVVTQRSQFSFVRRGQIPQANESSRAWQRATAIARIAHQDLWPSEAGDALYFHANYVSPRWAQRKTARATIDSHIFYR